jgi:hypothetical protein
MTCAPHQVLLFRYPIRDDKKGWACSMYGRAQTCTKRFGGEKKESGALALLNNPRLCIQRLALVIETKKCT